MKRKLLVPAVLATAAMAAVAPASAEPRDVEVPSMQADSPAPQVASNPNWVQSQVSAMMRNFTPRAQSWNSGAPAPASHSVVSSLDQATVRQLIARGATVEIPICPTYIQAGAGRQTQMASGVNSTSQCVVQGLSIGGGLRGR